MAGRETCLWCVRREYWKIVWYLPLALVPPTYLPLLTGLLSERWTNDTYVAAQHRVLYSRHQRHSITFFLSGWLDQVIECLPPFLKPGEEAKYKPQTVEENTLEWLSRGYGHNSKVEVQG